MNRILLILGISFAFLGGFISLNSDETVAANSDDLFAIKTEPKQAIGNDRSSLASVRESIIEFNYDAATLARAETLPITVFDSKQYTAKSGNVEIRAIDDVTWRGKIETKNFSGDMFLTSRKGYVAGMIYTPDAVYEIVAKVDKQILVQLDQSLFPDCYGDVKGVAEAKIPAIAPQVGTDSGDMIDVLVVYSTAVKNNVGGDVQARLLAQSAIDSANTAYLNSKIRQRLRLVHSEEIVYTETASASTDLSNLRSNSTIAAMRNTYKADMVSMISESVGVCGIGYLLNSLSGSPTNAFTVTVRSCAVGNLSFAHELGHNMGSQHNPENGSGPVFPYSYGHYVNGSYRTVMSYADPCTSGCSRVAYFSNPQVNYQGLSTGIDNQRDNARSIEQTSDIIAAYRYSGKSLTLNNLNNKEIVPRNISRTINWSSDGIGGNVRIELSRNESTNWETLIGSTPNDGSAVINIYGRPTKRARLRVVSLDETAVSDSSIKNFSIK